MYNLLKNIVLIILLIGIVAFNTPIQDKPLTVKIMDIGRYPSFQR